MLFLDEFAHVLGAGKTIDELLTPTEAPDCQGAVIEQAASEPRPPLLGWLYESETPRELETMEWLS